MDNEAFAEAIRNSPVLSEEVKRVLIERGAAWTPEIRSNLVAELTAYEEQVRDGAERFLVDFGGGPAMVADAE